LALQDPFYQKQEQVEGNIIRRNTMSEILSFAAFFLFGLSLWKVEEKVYGDVRMDAHRDQSVFR